jgi:hypothetical protein
MSDHFKEQRVIYIKGSLCPHGKTVAGLYEWLEAGWRVMSVTSGGSGEWLVVLEGNS